LPFVLTPREETRGPDEPLMRTTATITCPLCGHQAEEQMPIDACHIAYVCRGCGKMLRPQPGDCCVFCSYADTPCPPIQRESRQPPAH